MYFFFIIDKKLRGIFFILVPGFEARHHKEQQQTQTLIIYANQRKHFPTYNWIKSACEWNWCEQFQAKTISRVMFGERVVFFFHFNIHKYIMALFFMSAAPFPKNAALEPCPSEFHLEGNAYIYEKINIDTELDWNLISKYFFPTKRVPTFFFALFTLRFLICFFEDLF